MLSLHCGFASHLVLRTEILDSSILSIKSGTLLPCVLWINSYIQRQPEAYNNTTCTTRTARKFGTIDQKQKE
jgi:hypothetical protein